eukprot:9286744-Pyramimonas_sp.AAC.2
MLVSGKLLGRLQWYNKGPFLTNFQWTTAKPVGRKVSNWSWLNEYKSSPVTLVNIRLSFCPYGLPLTPSCVLAGARTQVIVPILK